MGISETKFNLNNKTEAFIINGYQVTFRCDRTIEAVVWQYYVKRSIN